MVSKKGLILLYGIIALIYLWADANTIQWLVYLTKPALVSTLLVYFWWSVQGKMDEFCKSIILGLLFAIAGDTFLLFDGNGYFMLGLGSFLLTHVFYSKAFFSKVPLQPLSQLLALRKWPLVFFLVLWVTLMTYLWPDLGGLQWPVLIYGVAITVMGFSAYNLRDSVSGNVFGLLFIGALVFIFSDSMIALDKFKSSQLDLSYPRLFIMIPYILAQYMIVEGSSRIIQ